VRLSRRTFPGLHSYSLGKLCTSLDIPLKDRHRARGDAHATVLLFHKILASENSETLIKSFLNARSQEATLPPSLDREIYEQLPDKTGIYFFKNSKGEIIYVGKAKNIKKRVLGHFYDKSANEVRLCRATSTIDFELSGNELVALLMESAAIKHHFPLYNRAQKRTIQQYALFSYEDRNGIMHLAYNKLKLVPQPLITFYNTTDCRLYMEELCTAFNLCPKYCHLQEQVVACSHFRIDSCEGICRGSEEVATYNKKVQVAIEFMRTKHENLMIKGKGRTADEDTIIVLKEGLYTGYGFIHKEETLISIEDIMAYVKPQKETIETKRLVQSYLIKNPEKIIPLEV
jgi:DNA polymerase-3 subunit epsilon